VISGGFRLLGRTGDGTGHRPRVTTSVKGNGESRFVTAVEGGDIAPGEFTLTAVAYCIEA
jgi:hypothetical protein